MPRAGALDGLADAAGSVGWQIVHDDDVAMRQGWDENLLDVSEESRTVHRAVEQHGRGETTEPEARGEGCGFPMPVWDGRAAAHAALGASAQARHLRGSAGLVDEDQLIGIEVGLACEPDKPARGDVRTLLLGSVRGFF